MSTLRFNNASMWTLVAALALACNGETPPPVVSGGDLAGLPRTVTQTITENGELIVATFNIQNTGDCPMSWSATLVQVTGGPWLSAVPLPTAGAPRTIAPGGMDGVEYTISVKPPALTAPLAPGTYQARIDFVATCTTTMTPATGSPASVLFNLRVSPLDAVFTVGPDIEKDVVTLTNNGAGTWRRIAQTGLPLAQDRGTTAVWTGRQVLLYGGEVPGVDGAPASATANGFAFDPLTLAATSLPTAGRTPGSRRGHTAVWTGFSMLLFGGRGATILSDGAGFSYSVGSNVLNWNDLDSSHTGIPGNPPAPRFGHQSVSAGDAVFVLGGSNFVGESSALNAGGYRSSGSTGWVRIAHQGAPAPASVSRLFWTGQYVLAATGAGLYRYNRVLDSWTNPTSAGFGYSQAAGMAFSGSKIFTWCNNDGAQLYDVVRDTLTRPTLAGLPIGGTPLNPIVAWTGSRFILITRDFQGRTGVYNPSGAGSWTLGPTNVLPAVDANSQTFAYPHAWTGKQLLVFVGGDVWSFE